MSNIIDINKNEKIKTIPSTEVAKMMERSHGDVLKMLEGQVDKNGKTKIVGIIPTLTKGELPPLDYFIESTHKDKSDKSNECYEENDLTINI